MSWSKPSPGRLGAKNTMNVIVVFVRAPAVCGASVHYDRLEMADVEGVCQACRVEASKVRATVLP